MSQIVNIQTKSVTKWDGLGLPMWVNGKLWCFGCTGAFKYDAVQAQEWYVEFPTTDFVIPGAKHLRSAYIGANDEQFSLTCTSDEMSEAVVITTTQASMSSHKAYGRRDIQGRYFKFKLMSTMRAVGVIDSILLYMIGRHNKPLK